MRAAVSGEVVSGPLLRVSHLTKLFERRGWGLRTARTDTTTAAVVDVSLEVHEGETVALVGESGSGKTTLGRCIVGLETPSSGAIEYSGKTLTPASLRRNGVLRRQIQMIFQDPSSSLNVRHRVLTILAEPLITHGLASGREELRSEVEDLLTSVGLSKDVARNFPHQFSGGQRQRIAIARSVAARPRLIVCDEPLSALDVSIQAQIMNLLKSLQRQQNLAYIFISHDMAVVRHIADRVLVMLHGHVVEEGPVDRVFESPQHPYTRLLIEAVPKGLASSGEHRTFVHSPAGADLADDPRLCPFRGRCPEELPTCSQRPAPDVFIASDHRVSCHARDLDLQREGR